MLTVNYKYNMRMPLASKRKDVFIEDLLNRYFTSFLAGELMLWISPLYEQGIQLVFDIDYHEDTMKAWRLITGHRLLSVVTELNQKYPGTFLLEKTPRGYHIICKRLYNYNIDFKSLAELREAMIKFFKNIPEIDISSTIRNSPIRRIGVDENNYAYYPIAEKSLINRLYLKTMPIRIISSKNYWTRYFKQNLIPMERKMLSKQDVKIVMQIVKNKFALKEL